jgi:predicted ATPase
VITSLSLVNFKCFRTLNIPLAGINILAGINGAGKSTVIQSLLALRQSLQSDGIIDRLHLRGTLTDLGTAAEVYCAEPITNSIKIEITHSDARPIQITSIQTKDQSADTSNEYFLRLENPISGATTSLLAEPFNYLNAERVGPRKAFHIPSDEENTLFVGKGGENAPYIIASKYRETIVSNDFVVLESANGQELPTIQYQAALWMARLFPGFDQEWELFRLADQGRLGLALQTLQTGQSLFVRPTNTGFGLSFVLGIIVAGLAAKPTTILIVENPEAHLHPRAQSGLGEFLGRVAAGGTQVFVETHSEHVLNGIRRMIKQSVLTPEAVQLFFFARVPSQLEPSVSPISISRSGDFSAWPDGFFDQLDKDLSDILP